MDQRCAHPIKKGEELADAKFLYVSADLARRMAQLVIQTDTMDFTTLGQNMPGSQKLLTALEQYT
ncbi:hypothetical protein GCM10010052_27110 [Paenarthrobacter histidinolovorans]|nr:hypothetical protein GCM10010052_27110 [Paenarthrobacter histidinolovorans]